MMIKLEDYLRTRLYESVRPMEFVELLMSSTPSFYILNSFETTLYDLTEIEKVYFWNLYSITKEDVFLDLEAKEPDSEFDDFINNWVETNRDNG